MPPPSEPEVRTLKPRLSICRPGHRYAGEFGWMEVPLESYAGRVVAVLCDGEEVELKPSEREQAEAIWRARERWMRSIERRVEERNAAGK